MCLISVQGPVFCTKVLLRMLVPKERLLALIYELSPNFGDGRGRSGGGGYGLTVGRLGDDLDPVVECHTKNEFWQLVVAIETTSAFLRALEHFEDHREVLFDRKPFDRIVWWRTVANVLSMGLVVRRCFQCSAGKS